MTLAAVRIRGQVGLRHDVRDALDSLNLRRKHACVLLEESPAVRGQLEKCKDAIAFGPVSDEVKGLLEKRGKQPYRLHPPRGGLGSIKRAYKQGGALGIRDSMDDLLKRMVA